MICLKFWIYGKEIALSKRGFRGQIKQGAMGLKLHEDWEVHLKCYDTYLSAADGMMFNVIHTDT